MLMILWSIGDSGQQHKPSVLAVCDYFFFFICYINIHDNILFKSHTENIKIWVKYIQFQYLKNGFVNFIMEK